MIFSMFLTVVGAPAMSMTSHTIKAESVNHKLLNNSDISSAGQAVAAGTNTTLMALSPAYAISQLAMKNKDKREARQDNRQERREERQDNRQERREERQDNRQERREKREEKKNN